MRPTVGIVVPAYQAERWLPMTLSSVCAQTYPDWTCVVVDDGSRDGTASVAEEWVRRDPRITLVRQENSGPPGARNAGLAQLPPVELVAFVDSDDLWLPDTLERLVAALQARPDAVGAYGLAEYVDASGTRIRAGEHPARQRERRRYTGGRWRGHLVPVAPGADLELAEMIVGCPFWPPATGVLRSTAVRAAGPFDESYRVQEDWEMWLRVVEHGPLVAVDSVVAEYRQHGANLTGNDLLNVTNQLRLRAEAGQRDGSELAVGAWRLLHVHRVVHVAWLLSKGARQRDVRTVALAGAALALWLPQLALPAPLSPGAPTSRAIWAERRAARRVAARS